MMNNGYSTVNLKKISYESGKFFYKLDLGGSCSIGSQKPPKKPKVQSFEENAQCVRKVLTLCA